MVQTVGERFSFIFFFVLPVLLLERGGWTSRNALPFIFSSISTCDTSSFIHSDGSETDEHIFTPITHCRAAQDIGILPTVVEHTFSAFWLRSSVVSVLISLISSTSTIIGYDY